MTRQTSEERFAQTNKIDSTVKIYI